MPTTTVVWGNPSHQWGVQTVGGVWLDLDQVASLGDLTLQTGVADGGVILDATLHQTFRLIPGALGTQFGDPPLIVPTSFSFFVSRAGGSVSPWRLQLGVVPSYNPANYETAVPAWGRNERDLGTFDLGAVPALPVYAQRTLIMSPNAQLELRAVVGQANWTGRLAVSLRTGGDDGIFRVANNPGQPLLVSTSQTTPFFTGLRGGPHGGPHRYVRDHRFGMPALNTQLVQDGDNPALWVRPNDWDPEDEPARYRPRPGEGTVNDKIPE